MNTRPSRLPRWVERMLPPSPLARRMSVQSMLYAVGEGIFFTGSAVFFTQVVGLSAAQVGVGLTVAGVVSFFVAVPLGTWADRFGPRRAWATMALAEAALYLVWPVIGGFAAYVAMMVVLELASTAGNTARGAYTLAVFPREERVTSRAFMRAALNVGFTLGAAGGGIALATGSDTVIRFVPVLTAVILAGNAVMIARLPDVAEPADVPAVAPSDESPISRKALRNRGFVALSALDGVLGTNQVVLGLVIPLWLVEETDAPRVLLAWLVATNTVIAVLLQVRAARGVDSVASSLRAARVSAAYFVVSCLIVLVTHDTVGFLTIALVWVGHVTVTGAELFQSAASWGFQAELSDPARLGEYQGASHVGHALGTVWAPALYTYLAMERGAAGWIVIAGIVAAATLLMPRAARSAERYLEQDHPAAPA